MAESPAEEILKELVAYISRRVRFKQTEIGWPEAARKLTLPAMSVMVKTAKMMPHPARILGTPVVESHKADTVYVVGEWEFSIQLDLWLATRAERYDMFEKIDQLFHGQSEHVSPVIHTYLRDYHNVLATYQIRGHMLPDDNQSALTQVWRVIVDIMASCDKIATRTDEPIITQTQLTVEVEGV